MAALLCEAATPACRWRCVSPARSNWRRCAPACRSWWASSSYLEPGNDGRIAFLSDFEVESIKNFAKNKVARSIDYIKAHVKA